MTVLGDHEFSINGWTADTASLGIQVFCEETTGSSNGINISQGFTKSKAGFGGIAVINSNSFESLPVDKNNNVLSNSTFDAYSLTATTINVFMGGVNLPYYGTSTAEVTAIGTDKPAAYWQYTQNDSGVNITPAAENTYTYPSSSNRYAALAIPAASAMPKTDNTASITWTLTVYVRNDSNTYTSETVTTTQRIVKNKNSANISAYTTVGHYSFDADNLTVESPATGYSINWNTTVPEGANAYITLEGGPLSSETKQTGSSYGPQSAPDYETSGTLNYPITFTAKLYNFDDGGNPSNVPTSADLLDVDTVTISASKSAVDDVVMELDNDNETVSGSTGVDIGNGSTTVVTTTATMFVNGNDDTSNWTFAISTLPSTLTGSLSGANNNGPTLNITEIDKTFTSAQITITASRNNYTDHQKVFTLTRVNDQATFKILSDHSAVTYNPNSLAYNPSDATVDFSFVKIENGQSSAFTGGAYKIDDGNAVTGSSSVSHTFTATQATSVNVKLYSDTSAAQLVDEETVPLIIGGEDGAPGTDGIVVDLTAERASVSYTKNAQQTYDADDNSVQLTVTTFGITNAQYTWTGGESTANSAQNSIAFANGVSETVAKQAKTASVAVQGQNSDGQAITTINKSITIGTSVGAVGADGATGLIGLQSTSGYIYSTGALTSAQATSLYQQLGYTGYSFAQQSLQGTDTNWSLNAPEFQANTTDSSTQYYYIRFTAQEARNQNGAPSGTTSRDASGGQSVQGSFTPASPQTTIGFTGLVTFSGTTITTGQQSFNYTAIDGAQITTGQIDAARINVAQINLSDANVDITAAQVGAQTSTGTTQQIQQQAVVYSQRYSQINAAGLGVLTATQTYTRDQSDQTYVIYAQRYSQITAAGLQVYTTSQVYSTQQTYDTTQADQTFETAQQVATAIQQGTANFLDQAQTDQRISQQAIPTTGTTNVSAGKIVLTSGNLRFTDSQQSSVYQPANAITLDTTSGNNSIRIYDSNAQGAAVLRVILGKL